MAGWPYDSPFILSLLVIVIVAGIGLLLLGHIRHRAPIEEGEQPIYKTSVGGYFNLVRSSFIGLRLYDKFMVLAALETYIVPYADIDAIEVYKPFGLEIGVEIHHKNPQIHQKVLRLSATNPRRIVEVVRSRMPK